MFVRQDDKADPRVFDKRENIIGSAPRFDTDNRKPAIAVLLSQRIQQSQTITTTLPGPKVQDDKLPFLLSERKKFATDIVARNGRCDFS
ncbi:hypothetical protein GMST_44000 [Geomonas silvestris]|uniref:Uncharacterized protein n=1 Tax=Geomonas silvestris TaxID=2740184 RepID=A0A6V8MPU0_9BACT|nr:hypothetical protein GMST_44000 [Geomonas silvestris]